MGQWSVFDKCVCSNGIKCLCDGGNGVYAPCLPYSSTETCMKARTQPVAKRGAYGGRDDCKITVQKQPCTEECKVFCLYFLIYFSDLNMSIIRRFC